MTGVSVASEGKAESSAATLVMPDEQTIAIDSITARHFDNLKRLLFI